MPSSSIPTVATVNKHDDAAPQQQPSTPMPAETVQSTSAAAPPSTYADEPSPFIVDGEGMYTVDDEGNIVDPAAEGSFLMAEALRQLSAGGDGDHNNADADAPPLLLEPYVPDFDVAERHAKAMAFFARHGAAADALLAAAAAAEGKGDTVCSDAAPAPTAEAAPSNADVSACQGVGADEDQHLDEEDEEYIDYGEEEKEEAIGSREPTDFDDWMLEAILARRANKAYREGGGEWEYRCKWRGYEEPTWELREALEDAGWIPQLDAYDAKGLQPRRKLRTGPPKVLLNFPELIESFFAKDDAELAKVIEKGGCTVRSYTRMNPKYAQRFYSTWQALRQTHVPVIVYHGTRPVNFPSIYRMGLVVGGTSGVAVANGTAHGRGVYTARTASTPLSYGSYASSIIACAGLVPIGRDGRVGTVFCTGDFVIFSDPAHVYPMWLVQTDGTTPEGGTTLCPGAPPFLDRESFFDSACSGFGRFPFMPNGGAYRGASGNFSSHSPIIGASLCPSTVIDKVYGSSASEALTEDDAKEAARALRRLVIGGSGGGGNSFSKAALKAQPRRVKELLARI